MAAPRDLRLALRGLARLTVQCSHPRRLPLLLLTALPVLAACSTPASASRTAAGLPGSPAPTAPGGGPVSPLPVLHLGARLAPFDAPLKVAVTGGALVGVTATPSATQPSADLAPSRAMPGATPAPLTGTVAPGMRAWVSTAAPIPRARYDIAADVLLPDGTHSALTGTVTVADVPAANRVMLSLLPGSSSTVGVGQPVIVRFDHPVTDRLAVETHAHVRTTTPVIGSWHWVSSRELHFRPRAYWPARTRVQVELDLNGVPVAGSRWGTRSYLAAFAIGDSHVTLVDGAKHRLTVRLNGKTVSTYPTSLGKPEFVTRSGTYVVLDRDPSRRMTSCNANITCDKTQKNWYDLTVNWDVRLTWSGTFVHAAPWSVGHQGRENVSHGCINLSDSHGKAFYALARVGDVVTVVNTRRAATDLVKRGDPGMADWNTPWPSYVAATALRHQVRTAALT